MTIFIIIIPQICQEANDDWRHTTAQEHNRFLWRFLSMARIALFIGTATLEHPPTMTANLAGKWHFQAE